MRLADIVPSVIRAWMARMEAVGLNGSRITQAVNPLSRILGDAVLDEVGRRISIASVPVSPR